jgi:hypothetical protein
MRLEEAAMIAGAFLDNWRFEMNDNNSKLRILLFDRVMPIAYVEMIAGALVAVCPTLFMILNIKLFTTERGGLTDPGIGMLIAATVLFFVGFAFFAGGNYMRSLCQHGFLAERDGRVYTFSLNSKRVTDGSIPRIGTVGKIVNSAIHMSNTAKYNERIDALKESSEFYDTVNQALDDNYSFLFAIRDINAKGYTSFEKKALLKEYNRLNNR